MYNVHPQRPAWCPPQTPFVGTQAQHAQGQQDVYQQQFPPIQSAGRKDPWEISYMKNKSLYAFQGTTEIYDDWTEDIFNHLNRTDRQWSDILEWVQVQPSDVETSQQALIRITISVARAWDLNDSRHLLDELDQQGSEEEEEGGC